MGRGELAVRWNVNKDNTLGHLPQLAGQQRPRLCAAGMDAGAGQRPVGRQSNLRLHTALFSGYGDSMIDYNRKRTVFSLGVSLVDF